MDKTLLDGAASPDEAVRVYGDSIGRLGGVPPRQRAYACAAESAGEPRAPLRWDLMRPIGSRGPFCKGPEGIAARSMPVLPSPGSGTAENRRGRLSCGLPRRSPEDEPQGRCPRQDRPR